MRFKVSGFGLRDSVEFRDRNWSRGVRGVRDWAFGLRP